MLLNPARRLACLLLLTQLLSTGIQAESIQDYHQKLRESLAAGDATRAAAILVELGSHDYDGFLANDYDYLLARLEEQLGNRTRAAVLYNNVASRKSALRGYAVWRLAGIAKTEGNPILERQWILQLLTTFPDSLLAQTATKRLAASFLDSGSFAEAIAALKPLAGSKYNDAGREAMVLLGKAYLGAGQPDEARAAFRSVESDLPAQGPDDHALAAVRALDELDKQSSSTPFALDENEHLRRAAIYHFNRDFEGARTHYLAVTRTFPNSGNVAQAVYQLGRTYYQERRFTESLEFFNRISKDFPSSPSVRDALAFKASALARLNQYDAAVETYGSLIDIFPSGTGAERPFLNIIDTLRDAKRDKEALQWVEKTRDRFKGQPAASLALFAGAKIHLSNGEWQSSLSALDTLRNEVDTGGTRVQGGTTPMEVDFLRAFALEQLHQYGPSIDAYLSIPDGRDQYYGQRATERLRALAANAELRAEFEKRTAELNSTAARDLNAGRMESARAAAQSALRLVIRDDEARVIVGIISRCYQGLPAYRLDPQKLQSLGRTVPRVQMLAGTSAPSHSDVAEQLLFLQLYDEALPELAASRSAPVTKIENTQTSSQAGLAPTTSPETAYTYAVYSARADRADDAVRYAEPLWKKVPADFLMMLAPPELARLLYPSPYRQALLAEAPKRGVDPRFVLSIARQESRFKPDAKSGAAARGLLQFIPSTASETANQVGLKSFDQNLLYRPSLAILLGSQYLGTLFKQFPDMPQAVAASYNGGEDNMARWVTRSKSTDPDRYVCEIGFGQSKDYVYKVLANFHEYSRLYDGRLQPISQ
jgi:soluble lytic murein transglycosylase